MSLGCSITSTSTNDLTSGVGDLRQIASVRRIVLDDGPERGVRALSFSTGGGLDFWVLSDRSLDIGPLWCNGSQIGWQHPTGFVSPGNFDRYDGAGYGLERALSGFLVTCGLDTIRKPTDGLPQHGHLPVTPARMTGYGEDWDAPEPYLFCEGTVTIASLKGSSLRLHRRIEAPIGRKSFSISDKIENLGPEPVPIALLYHFNIGFPAVTQETKLALNDVDVIRVSGCSEPEFVCVPTENEDALVSLSGGAVDVEIRYPGTKLPWLQAWSDPRPRRNILAVEPATSERNADGSSGPGAVLEPNACWTSKLNIEVMPSAEKKHHGRNHGKR
jgi:hypothetical protein